MTYYDLVVAPLDEVRAETSEALKDGRSPMTVRFFRQIETAELVPLMEKVTRTLFGRLLG